LGILLVNCTPLSVMTTFGTPYLAIMRSLKALFRDSAEVRTNRSPWLNRASLCIPGQYYRAARRAMVLRLPSWPVAGESWFSFSTISRRAFGTHIFQVATSSLPVYEVYSCIGWCHPPSRSPGTLRLGPYLSAHFLNPAACCRSFRRRCLLDPSNRFW